MKIDMEKIKELGEADLGDVVTLKDGTRIMCKEDPDGNCEGCFFDRSGFLWCKPMFLWCKSMDCREDRWRPDRVFVKLM